VVNSFIITIVPVSFVESFVTSVEKEVVITERSLQFFARSTFDDVKDRIKTLICYFTLLVTHLF
jgi:hypothetical protein